MTEDLLLKYLKGECNSKELDSIIKWLELSKNNEKYLFDMEKAWSSKELFKYHDPQNIDSAYRKVINKTIKRPLHVWRTAFQIAAAAIIVLMVGLDLYNRNNYQITTNTIEVPSGQRVAVTLSDQTKVWLNAGTKFTYPSAFSKKNRNVTLIGEAFFQVKHNEKKPFIVHTNDLDIKVLGTVFNVYAYKNSKKAVTLCSGKVEVTSEKTAQKVILLPNQQAVYKNNQLILHKKVNSRLARLWVDGELAYLDEPLSTIAKGIERQFSTKIIIEDKELAAKLFTCHFRPDISLYNALKLLKDTHRVDYEITNEYIKLYKPKNN